MQLLRDNLTLWTSSDGNEQELASEAPKDTEKTEASETAVPEAAGSTTQQAA